MEQEIEKRLDAQRELLEAIYRSTEKTRKYFLYTLIVSLVLFVLPLIGLIFVLPNALSVYTSGIGGI